MNLANAWAAETKAEVPTAYSWVGPPCLCRVIVWVERDGYLIHVGGPAARFLSEPIKLSGPKYFNLPPRH